MAINAANAQAYLWKADAQRQLAAAEKSAARQRQLYSDAREGYRQFLDRTNFSSGFVSRLAFHAIGMGVGSRSHADRLEAYDSLRSAGFLGLCLSEQKVGNLLRARDCCQRALKHTPNDPIGYFLLGNVNRDLFNARASCQDLMSARSSYQRMLTINGDIDEARNARNSLGQIEAIAKVAGC